MELQISDGSLKGSILKVFETISKPQHRRFQSESRPYQKFIVVYIEIVVVYMYIYTYIYINIYIYTYMGVLWVFYI